MAGTLLCYPRFKALDSTGTPYGSGKVYTYISGSTTPRVSYSDKDLTTPNANPVILDSNGEATIYLSGTYKIILRDSSDNLIWTMDNIEGIPRSDPITAKGDLIQGGTSGVPQRLAIGTSGQFLVVGASGLWEPQTFTPSTYKLDDLAAPDDNTDLNASISAHGLLPKLSGTATQFLTGVGTWVSVNSVPVGSGMLWFTNTPPTGYLLCQGQEISRTTYSALFALFNAESLKYGVGDGSTTFNLPNLKQRFPLGRSDSGTGAVLGETGGTIDKDLAHEHSGGALGGSISTAAGDRYTDSQGAAYNPPYLTVNFAIKY